MIDFNRRRERWFHRPFWQGFFDGWLLGVAIGGNILWPILLYVYLTR